MIEQPMPGQYMAGGYGGMQMGGGYGSQPMGGN